MICWWRSLASSKELHCLRIVEEVEKGSVVVVVVEDEKLEMEGKSERWC